MSTLGFPLLSLIVWLPLLGAALLVALPGGRIALYRWVALGFSLATLALTGVLTALFISGPYGNASADVLVPLPLQFVDEFAWVPQWGASYLVGVDGINLWLVALTAFLGPIVVVASRLLRRHQVRQGLALLLLLQTALTGVFVAQDLLLFYVFWELSLVAAAFLIGMQGGPARVKAATKLFIYTFAGSLLMLMGIVVLYLVHGGQTFDISAIAADLRSGAVVLTPMTERLLFGLFFAAFAIKTALWPFHSWLPDAYAEAPTAAAIFIASVMSKLGLYGFVRVALPLFPNAAQWAAPAIGLLAVIGIVYGAAIAFRQKDLTRIIAYASLSHLNLIVLGVFALNLLGVSGALFLMVSHGVVTAALLLMIGAIYERRQTRDLDAIGGLWASKPVLGGLALTALLANLGLPGLSNFVGEFVIFQGVYSSPVLGWEYALGAVLGTILMAACMLRLFRASFMSDPTTISENVTPDLNRRERALFALALAPVVIAGLAPSLLFGPLQGAVGGTLAFVQLALGG
jgi:NADH-quinone oxidoreductase subunit M